LIEEKTRFIIGCSNFQKNPGFSLVLVGEGPRINGGTFIIEVLLLGHVPAGWHLDFFPVIKVKVPRDLASSCIMPLFLKPLTAQKRVKGVHLEVPDTIEGFFCSAGITDHILGCEDGAQKLLQILLVVDGCIEIPDSLTHLTTSFSCRCLSSGASQYAVLTNLNPVSSRTVSAPMSYDQSVLPILMRLFISLQLPPRTL